MGIKHPGLFFVNLFYFCVEDSTNFEFYVWENAAPHFGGEAVFYLEVSGTPGGSSFTTLWIEEIYHGPGERQDSLYLHHAPEPSVIGLLGLGSLFLLRMPR